MPPTESFSLGCHTYLNDIKIYEGTTPKIKKNTLARIQQFKPTESTLFSPLKPSTLTARGKFSNVKFMEKKLIHQVSIPAGCNILKVGCNYGEIFNVSPPYIAPRKKQKTSNRGRKPKKKISTRKIQGTGKYFSSQIQVSIYNLLSVKPLKIKIFRTGIFQVPGIRDSRMRDLIKPLHELKDWLRVSFKDETIEILYLISVMRNYKCRLTDPCKKILLKELCEALNREKNNPIYEASVKNTLSLYLEDCTSIISDYAGCNFMDIAEIHYNSERYFGLMVKFRKPVPWNMEKKTTIKILSSGKINFDGCNSELEAMELYYWLRQFIEINYDTVIYDPDEYVSEESSSDPNKSVYDDELESEDDDSVPIDTIKLRDGLSYHLPDDS